MKRYPLNVLLTSAEYFSLSLNSRQELLETNSVKIAEREVLPHYIISLHDIYNFRVESYFDLANRKVVRIDPVFNREIINLYT